jgi:hypothetical protein
MAVFEEIPDFKDLHVVGDAVNVKYHRREYNNGIGYYVTFRDLKSGDNFGSIVPEMLKKFGGDIHTINIKNNNLGDNAAEAIKELLVGSPDLESINLDNNPLGKDVVNVLKDVLPSFKDKGLWIIIRDTNITESDMKELKNLCWKLGIKICSWYPIRGCY